MARTLAPNRMGRPNTGDVRPRRASGSVDDGGRALAGSGVTDYAYAVAGPFADLKDAVHEAASTRVWSQGVTLCRDDRVSARSSTADEVVYEVRLPGRPTPFTVVLYT